MKIDKILVSEGKGGFFFDDQEAIRQGAERDGFIYKGEPIVDGFKRIRQPSEAVSILLILEDGQVAIGDCVTNQYSGVGGREPVFSSSDIAGFVRRNIAQSLQDQELTSFRSLAKEYDTLTIDGHRAPAAVRYGVTSSILNAIARVNNITLTEVITREYDLPLIESPVAIFGQSGDSRYKNVDKMILKRVDALPHGLINSVDKVGTDGKVLKDYLKWIVDRIEVLGNDNYQPLLHFDLYGTLGIVFEDIESIADYLGQLHQIAKPRSLRIEYPIVGSSKGEVIDANQELKRILKRKGIPVKISADEWANSPEDIQDFIDAGAADAFQVKSAPQGGINNTIESILLCKEENVEVYLGISCTETDISARICTQIALATRVDQTMASPGMGFDVGYEIVYNEMYRTLELLKLHSKC